MKNNTCLSSCWCCRHPSSTPRRRDVWVEFQHLEKAALVSLFPSFSLSLAAPCTVGIKRGRIFYNSRKLWIADLKPNRVLHGEHVAFYCLNKAERCGYPVASSCQDGSLPIPECFEGVRPGQCFCFWLLAAFLSLFLHTQGSTDVNHI